MSNFITAVNVVMPVFLMIALGYFIRAKGIINQQYIDTTMKLVFNIGLPAMLFMKVSKSDVEMLMTREIGIFALYVVVSTIFIFFIARIISRLMRLDTKTSGTFVQGSFRSNYVIIGSAVLFNLLGDVITTKIAVLVITVVPLYNIFAVIILSGNEKKGFWSNVKSTVLKIVKNPLIIGIALGFLVAIFDIQLPSILDDTIHMAGSIGTPLGLLGIGAYFNLQELGNIKLSAISVLLKVIVFPAIVVGIAYLLGFEYVDLSIIFVLFGSPTAVSSFIMATAMDGDSRLAANIVILSTALSMFSLVIGLGILGMFT